MKNQVGKTWQLAASLAIAVVLTTPSASAQVYRCGNVYQEAPCKGGRAVNVSPPVSDPDGPSRVRIYLCKKPSGSLAWINGRCSDRGWTIERSEIVSARASWDEQVEEARAKRDAAQRLRAEAEAPRSAPAPRHSPPSSNAEQCASLDQRVAMLDSMGRAGSLYYDLDWVRRERKKARDAQHGMRCR